jgi:hypothetical protein
MKRQLRHRWLVVALVVLPLLLAACGSDGTAEEAAGPAVVEEVAGSDLMQITLTPEAAKRLDIQTMAVEENGSGTVIPYSAVYYAPTGETWAYVSTKPLTFVREAIVIEDIEGDRAILSDGPAAGTQVATVGVAELFGAESGLGQ